MIAPTEPDKLPGSQNAALLAEQWKALRSDSEAAEDYFVSVGADAIPLLVKAISSRNAVLRRRGADALQRIAPNAIEAVLPLLKHNNARVQKVVLEALRDTHDERIHVMFAEFLRDNLRAAKQHKRKQMGWLLLLFCCLWICSEIRLSISQDSPWRLILKFLNVGFVMGEFSISFWFVLKTTAQMKQDAMSNLCNTGDARFLGLLALCLKDADEQVRMEAERALVNVLPYVTEADRTRLTSNEKKALVHNMESRLERHLLVLLPALEKIGDETMIPSVEKLWDRTPFEKVREAAETCLLHLHRHVAQNAEARNLLRPAGVEEVAPQTLLRPASSVSDAETEKRILLRGVESSEG